MKYSERKFSQYILPFTQLINTDLILAFLEFKITENKLLTADPHLNNYYYEL